MKTFVSKLQSKPIILLAVIAILSAARDLALVLYIPPIDRGIIRQERL